MGSRVVYTKGFKPKNKPLNLNETNTFDVILGGPLYVIVEYCEHGNLRDFLRQHDSRNEGYERPNSQRLIISERTLVSFARQVSSRSNLSHFISNDLSLYVAIFKNTIFMNSKNK